VCDGILAFWKCGKMAQSIALRDAAGLRRLLYVTVRHEADSLPSALCLDAVCYVRMESAVSVVYVDRSAANEDEYGMAEILPMGRLSC
jgi:hypothetical protein